ncbi:barstar family protein [Paenibacillus massiliensis]|uniref:barstar family protein n=1 Tax=Paenibacillus massiliensis TaxID=225917 RepID=UPI0004242CCC|nr:barstar family protein [Paenibacillus massiliensis]
MTFKYAIMDDETDTIIGHCTDVQVISLDEDELIEACVTEGFVPSKVDLNTHRQIHNIFLALMDEQSNVLGGYYCYLEEPVSYKNLNSSNLYFIINSAARPTTREFQLWEYFRRGNLFKGNWLEFDYQGKIAWLRVVRMHSPSIDYMDVTQGSYTINCRNITDRSSLYIELGEAINGPGGYYGSCLDSLHDCLCGGFGAVPPYKLIWEGFEYLVEWSVDQRCYSEHDNSMTLQAYIQEAIQLLEEYGISNHKE